MNLKNLIKSDVDRVLINDRDFAETIVLHTSPFKCEVQALVSFDEPAIVEDEIPELEGRVSISVKDAGALGLKSTPVLSATIREQEWHLFGPPSTESGMVTLNIRRHQSEEPYSNLTDLNDEQARLL